jgi:hypothetical protein
MRRTPPIFALSSPRVNRKLAVNLLNYLFGYPQSNSLLRKNIRRPICTVIL